jgi:hypothetical protein
MRWTQTRSVFPLFIGLAVAACGSAEPTPSEAVTSTAAEGAPATAVFVPPDPDVTVGSLVPVEVTEPCPTSASFGGGSEMLDEATRLEPMLGLVLAYGQAHPDVWGSYGLVWLGDSDASVFVSFTKDIEAHRAALTQQAAFPDELIVCESPITGAEAQALQAQLWRELAGRAASVGVGLSGAVEVVLLAGEEQTAAELVAQYGDAVVVTFGELEQSFG